MERPCQGSAGNQIKKVNILFVLQDPGIIWMFNWPQDKIFCNELLDNPESYYSLLTSWTSCQRESISWPYVNYAILASSTTTGYRKCRKQPNSWNTSIVSGISANARGTSTVKVYGKKKGKVNSFSRCSPSTLVHRGQSLWRNCVNRPRMEHMKSLPHPAWKCGILTFNLCACNPPVTDKPRKLNCIIGSRCNL